MGRFKGRFTELQLVLIQGIKDLIYLYNDHIPTDPSGKRKKVNWEVLGEKTEQFLESFFGQPYFKKPLEKDRESREGIHSIDEMTGKEVLKISCNKLFKIKKPALKDFIDLMGELKGTVNKKPYSHFLIRGSKEAASSEYNLLSLTALKEPPMIGLMEPL